jgi:hypothetical protein
MSYEFGIMLTDAPNPCGGFNELPRTPDDDFAGEYIPWDDAISGYSGWNHASAHELARDTGDTSYELLDEGGGGQSYVKLSKCLATLDKFEAQLPNIQSPVLRARCEALIAGCRLALALDSERATLLIF